MSAVAVVVAGRAKRQTHSTYGIEKAKRQKCQLQLELVKLVFKKALD